MQTKNLISILGIRLPPLILKKAIPIAVAMILILSTVFITSSIIGKNTVEVVEVEAKSIANTIVTSSPNEVEIDISASVELSTWYKHWGLNRISIDKSGPFSDPDDIMEIKKDTFQVVLSFPEDTLGPKSDYIWYEDINEPTPHPITCNGVECVKYDPTYGTEYQGAATFYIEDVFNTLPSDMGDGCEQNLEIKGYYLSKIDFTTSCDITIIFGDIYVKQDGTEDYKEIQKAINGADSGDTIYVYGGDPYNEKITVNKSVNLVGECENTIIDGTDKDNFVVKLTAIEPRNSPGQMR